MALVVEDGAGLSTANGYITLAFFKSFAAVEDLTSFPANDTKIQYAIQRATRYIDTRFRFIGYRKLETQSLEWPRVDAYYEDGRLANGVPIEVQEACAFYTFRALTARLAPDPVYDSTGGRVIRKIEKVEGIERETEFAAGGSPYTFRKYPEADQRLKELVISGRSLMRA